MRFGWFFALPLLFVALLAGSCGYAMGVSSSAIAPVVAAPAVHPMWGFGGFFPFFGFIFFLVVIFAIVGAFKRRSVGRRLRTAQRVRTRSRLRVWPGTQLGQDVYQRSVRGVASPDARRARHASAAQATGPQHPRRHLECAVGSAHAAQGREHPAVNLRPLRRLRWPACPQCSSSTMHQR